MNKQMTPAEIELFRQSFARLAFGIEYNEGGSHAHENAREYLNRRGSDKTDYGSQEIRRSGSSPSAVLATWASRRKQRQ